MNVSKFSRSGFLAGAGGATLAAVAATSRPASAGTAVAVAASPADDLTPVVYALQSGLFERNGLDVHLD
jgi:ABC-type nitrate/sulfonate/bicarbonate transport system substrate-binding protein